ncbi:PQQ-dependent sugar dehydrogenase [Luteolibacter arcticus]|uniref:PQQ-dependent sugar dehydrogenase n=1 Tax=Luteolibacter arcticus TaxID=1581411 RepID=A0ABT3GBI4_9BACT|nr:LamG-like jellyroll fold domain-containing protein [Luteolibacter arcticus]MCW1920986.1 PQQ-dependent sugar dehydrogenase [Luteolibacter arcticus]
MSLLTGGRADLVNRWSFNNAVGNAPAGTTIADRVGTSTAAVVGLNASFNGSSLVVPGTTTGNQTPANIAAYVDLPNGLISTKTNLSVEIWATPVSVKNWQRLFDFGRMGQLQSGVRGGMQVPAGEIQPNATQAPNDASSSDDFALAIHRTSTANTQRMMGRLDGLTETGSNTGASLAAGTQYHFLCTFTDGLGTFGSSGGQMAWYLNGTLVSTLDVDFHLAEVQDRNNWLGRSMYSADSNANVAYNEVRLYNHVLTPAEITANIAAGPDNLGEAEPDPPPVPDNLWAFTTQADSEAESGTTFADSIGGVVATLRGNGGSLTGGSVVLPGSTTGNQPASTISAYLDLPNGLVTQTPSVSFEAWASPLSSKSWQRLFDFGRCAASHGTGGATGEILDTAIAPGNTAAYDNLSLTFNNAGNMNSQQLEGQYDGNPAQYTFTTAATTAGTSYHYVLVVEDGIGTYGSNGCQARWYRNGVLQNSMDFQFHLSGMEDVNNWIGRSMYSGDSNAHMALDELRIYRRAITPSEITASFTAGPDPAVGPPEPPAPAPVPTRRWTFDTTAGNAPAGTIFLDIATGEVATVQGNGATLTGTQLLLPGTTTNGNQTAANISAYLDLPNGILSSRPDLTFEAWATPVSSKNWQRLFDFGNSSITSGPGAETGEIIDSGTAPGAFVANDNLFLSLNNVGTLGSHRLEAKLAGDRTVTNNADLSSATTAGTQYHYVMTVKDGGGASGATGCLVKWFRNGTLIGSIDLPYRLPDLHDVNNWIGRSMWAADMNSNLSLDELRIYDRAITTAEVASTFTAGPDATFAPPVAGNDQATIHANQKVLIDVLANDTGEPVSGSLQIVNPPSAGVATLSHGKILYTHTGSSAAPVVFTYSISNVSGTTVTGTVTIDFASSLRLTNPALAMPAAPPVTSWQLVEALPGLVFNRPVSLTSVPGDANQLYVCEQGGIIKRVADVTSLTPATNVFLDLSALGGGFNIGPLLAGQPENGLLGLAFHPNYATNGYFYVAYTVSFSGDYFQRVSRFTRDTSNPTIANPASEEILLHIDDFGLNHNGGDLHFGPNDGYLYYGTGDGDNSRFGQERSQKIDDDFYSGIFRIDVDKKPGSLPPNPHNSIYTDDDDGVADFHVPPDNPFVHTSLSPSGTWNGTYNGVDYTGSLGSVRTEFWATGIRHAWRMSFDPVTGDLWEGDVGQNTYEEINKIVKGGNYGWAYREGAHNHNGALGTAPVGFTSINPVYEYVHTGVAGGDAAYKGNSVVGGYVYRGTRYPSLAGSYVFSDSVSGHVWQMNTTTGATTRLTGLPGAYGVLSSQGVDPYNKDLLFCAYLTGKIMRLGTGSTVAGSFPTTLSETSLFADLTDLSPSPGLLPYQPNLAFWSDHAIKRRWFTIPNASDKMTWSKDGNWTYPAGTVWVKHFDLEMSRGNPATKKRIETRVLVKTDTTVYGVSYRWNEAQTEANLVEDAGTDFDLAIDDHGTPHTQRWQIPSRSSCLTCHTPQGGHALSFNTRQLNLTNTINGYSGNQLDVLAANNFLSNTPDPVATLSRHLRPDETQYPLEQRARSYFAVNCSYCHQAGGSVSGLWDGRAHLTLEQTGLINGVAENDGDNPLNKYIVPGDTTHSIVLNRMAATNGFGRMPPLGTSEVDPANIQLITEWINSDLPNRPLYDQWRDGFFAINNPDGIKSADPDGDGASNYDEYLLGSSPVAGSDAWQASIAGGSLQFLRKSHRYYAIQTSDDLSSWQPWSIPEIDSAYQSSDTLTEIPLPADPDGMKFFRFQVTEP